LSANLSENYFRSGEFLARPATRDLDRSAGRGFFGSPQCAAQCRSTRIL